MPDFTNASISIETLPKYQEVPFISIHKKYWNVIAINLSIFAMILIGAVAITFLSVYSHPETETGISFYLVLLGAAIGFIGFLFWINRIAFRKKSYAIREKDILYRSGVLATSTTIIPLSRIQHIAVNEGVLSRMYDLASIEIYTAGGSSSDLRILGIEKEKAYSIKEFLMNNIDTATGEKQNEIEEIPKSDSEDKDVENQDTTQNNQ